MYARLPTVRVSPSSVSSRKKHMYADENAMPIKKQSTLARIMSGLGTHRHTTIVSSDEQAQSVVPPIKKQSRLTKIVLHAVGRPTLVEIAQQHARQPRRRSTKVSNNAHSNHGCRRGKHVTLAAMRMDTSHFLIATELDKQRFDHMAKDQQSSRNFHRKNRRASHSHSPQKGNHGDYDAVSSLSSGTRHAADSRRNSPDEHATPKADRGLVPVLAARNRQRKSDSSIRVIHKVIDQ